MFWRLRVLMFYASLAVCTILLFMVCYIPITFFNLRYHTKYKIATIFSCIFVWLAKIYCGLKYQVSGLHKLPVVPSIVVSNHQSFWDHMFLPSIIPEHSWVLKRELLNIPLFGWGLRTLEPIAVDRSTNISVNQILKEGQKKINSGLWLVIYPESTKIGPAETRKFKPSAVKLASLIEVPIVMIAHNAGVYWPKGFWIKQPGNIQIKIIDVITVEEIQQSEVRTLTEKIEQVINREKQILFEQVSQDIS